MTQAAARVFGRSMYWADLSEDQVAALMQAYDRDVAAPWAGERNSAEACCDLGLLEVRRLRDVEGLNSIVYVLTRFGADLVRARLHDEGSSMQRTVVGSPTMADCYQLGTLVRTAN